MMNIVEQIENMFVDGWIIPKKPAFNANSFPARCRYAAWAICADNHDRKADDCFEMYDGSAVVTALIRAAKGGKADYLLHCIKGQFATSYGFDKWCETADKYSYWDDDQLQEFARCEREEARAISKAFRTELTPEGEQFVIPGCEKQPEHGNGQGSLW